MILNALFISENKVVEQFDTEKHTKDEEKAFRNKYLAKDGFCISSTQNLDD